MALLLTLPPELRAMVATFLDFNSLLALSKSSPLLKQFKPDFQTFSATRSMQWFKVSNPDEDVAVMQEFPVFFPLAELRVCITWLQPYPSPEQAGLHRPAKIVLVAYTEDSKEKRGKTLVHSRKVVPVTAGTSEEIVFKVGLSGSEVNKEPLWSKFCCVDQLDLISTVILLTSQQPPN